MSRVYTFSVPNGYDLDAVVRRASGGRRLSRSALILRALEEYGAGSSGGRIDHYTEEGSLEGLLDDRPHDELLAAVRRMVEHSPDRARAVHQQAMTLARLIDHVGKERPGVS